MTRPDTPPALTFFILLNALPAWLSLNREERSTAWRTPDIAVALANPDRLSLRFFDSVAFSAMCSDVLMVEAADIDAHNDFMEAVRDSPVFARPYFDLVAIIPALEEGFRRYEARRDAPQCRRPGDKQ